MAEQTATELIDAIRESGLQIEVDETLAANRTAIQLAKQLVEDGKLTRWQARELLEGNRQLCLGKFQLLDKLGEGGMGTVYKAFQPGMNRTVAIKVVSEVITDDESTLRRFFREAQALAAVHHENIIYAHDVVSEGDLHFLVMEFVEARDIQHWIKQHGRLPIAWSCECIRQAAVGMEPAHQRGLIHRDVKPGNLLAIGSLTEQPLVKILDLGLARFNKASRGEVTELTQTRDVLGTPDFMAPEQGMSTKRVDIRADVYSLGCTLYNMLTGDLPFPGETSLQVMVARATQDPPHVSELRSELPPELDAVIFKMMAREAEDRYQTPGEVAEALAPFCDIASELEAAAGPEVPIRFAEQPPAAGAGHFVSTKIAATTPSDGHWTQRIAAAACLLLVLLGLGGAAYRLRFSPADVVLAVEPSQEIIISEPPSTDPPPTVDPSPSVGQANGLPYQKLIATFVARSRNVIAMDISPDNRTLAYGTVDGTVQLYDLEQQQHIAQFDGHKSSVDCVRFTHDGKYLLSAGRDTIIRRWDLAARELKDEWKGHDDWIRDGVFLPDRETFATCGSDGKVRFWKGDQEARPALDHPHPLLDLDVSPDGRLLAAAQLYGDVLLWDLRTFDLVHRISAFEGHCQGVCFSPDGQLLIARNEDGARVFDTNTRKVVSEIANKPINLAQAFFTPSGEMVISWGKGGLQLWDSLGQRKLGTLDDSASAMGSYAFSPDKQLLITGHYRSPIRVFSN